MLSERCRTLACVALAFACSIVLSATGVALVVAAGAFVALDVDVLRHSHVLCAERVDAAACVYGTALRLNTTEASGTWCFDDALAECCVQPLASSPCHEPLVAVNVWRGAPSFSFHAASDVVSRDIGVLMGIAVLVVLLLHGSVVCTREGMAGMREAPPDTARPPPRTTPPRVTFVDVRDRVVAGNAAERGGGRPATDGDGNGDDGDDGSRGDAERRELLP
jgi:hypothetical protein